MRKTARNGRIALERPSVVLRLFVEVVTTRIRERHDIEESPLLRRDLRSWPAVSCARSGDNELIH